MARSGHLEDSKFSFKWSIKTISNLFYYLSAGGIFLVLSVVFSNVVARYIFNSPFHWAEEVTAITVILLGFFPAGELWRRNNHIKFDLLTLKLSKRLQKTSIFIDIVINLSGLLFSGLLVWESFKATKMTYLLNMREPTILNTPLCIPYSFMLLGSTVLFIVIIERFLKTILHLIRPHNE